MNCVKCGKGPADGVTIYRTTPKGQEPNWHCEKCLDPNKHPAPDKITLELSHLLEKK